MQFHGSTLGYCITICTLFFCQSKQFFFQNLPMWNPCRNPFILFFFALRKIFSNEAYFSDIVLCIYSTCETKKASMWPSVGGGAFLQIFCIDIFLCTIECGKCKSWKNDDLIPESYTKTWLIARSMDNFNCLIFWKCPLWQSCPFSNVSS